MTLYYLPTSNELINDAHIISATFKPEHISEAHVDFDSGQQIPERLISAKLNLVLTELELEDSINWEGDVRGCASSSAHKWIEGDEAILLWGALCRNSYNVGILVHDDLKKEIENETPNLA